MATSRILIKGGKAVGCISERPVFISDDGTIIFINEWSVEVRYGRIICSTKYGSFFESSLYQREFYLYFDEGELILTDGIFNRRRAYYIAKTNEEDSQLSSPLIRNMEK